MFSASVRTLTARVATAAAALALGILPAACDKETTAPQQVAATDLTVGVNSNIAAAISGLSFTFPGGGAALAPEIAGQNIALTMTTTGATTTTVFVITSATGATTGTFTAATSFGSCTFVVTSSSFATGHRLAAGNTVTINQCNVRLGTQGAPADSVARARAAVFVLGSAVSNGTTVTVTINPGGSITVNGRDAGTVTLVPVTG